MDKKNRAAVDAEGDTKMGNASSPIDLITPQAKPTKGKGNKGKGKEIPRRSVTLPKHAPTGSLRLGEAGPAPQRPETGLAQTKSHNTVRAKTRGQKGVILEAERYEVKHQGAVRTWEHLKNTRRGRDRRGLREYPSQSPPQPRPTTAKPAGPTTRQLPPPQPIRQPATGVNGTPLGNKGAQKGSAPNPTFQHDLVITGPGILAVSEQDALRRTRWNVFYNDALKGSGIEVMKVTLDPKFPMERKLRCRTEKTMEATRDTILAKLRNNPGIDTVWEQAEYAEVVIHGVVVPRGYTVASLGVELRAALEKLNPGKLGPRNPVFLAAPMTKTDKASLRVCLSTRIPTENMKLKAPTPGGIADLECFPYVRNRVGGGYWTDKQGYMNCNHWDAGTKRNWPAWGPKGIRTTGHLQVQCIDCGKRDHASGECRKERRDTGPIPPYGECYICKDKSHWANFCPERRF